MATATLKLTVNAHPNGVDNTQRHEVLYGIATLSTGGTYATNGIPCTFTFLDGATGGVELTNGAAITADTIGFQLEFNRGY